MKKILKYFLKILKWLVLLVVGFYFFGIGIFGFKAIEPNGSYSIYWSGIEALWDSEEEFGFWLDKKMNASYNGADGPYIIGDSAYFISPAEKLYAGFLKADDTIVVRVNNKSSDSFEIVRKQGHSIESEIFEMPSKILAISDIEGNFDAFSGFLEQNQLIDKDFNWIFGDGHLVLLGDFVDRGESVPQVLWLIYKLEQEAEKQDGKVHYILGNHEVMNFQGKWGYNAEKYRKASQEISGFGDWCMATKYMYSEETELGEWLRNKNIIEKIGSYIFVHAGLSLELLDYHLKLSDINQNCRSNWDHNDTSDNDTVKFLLGGKGPLWYRGMSEDHKQYTKITDAELFQILDYYDAEKIVIGHTLADDVTSDFEGKVIRIDLRHGKSKFSGETKGLLIENGLEYVVDDKGGRNSLKK